MHGERPSKTKGQAILYLAVWLKATRIRGMPIGRFAKGPKRLFGAIDVPNLGNEACSGIWGYQMRARTVYCWLKSPPPPPKSTLLARFRLVGRYCQDEASDYLPKARQHILPLGDANEVRVAGRLALSAGACNARLDRIHHGTAGSSSTRSKASETRVAGRLALSCNCQDEASYLGGVWQMCRLDSGAACTAKLAWVLAGGCDPYGPGLAVHG